MGNALKTGFVAVVHKGTECPRLDNSRGSFVVPRRNIEYTEQ